MTVLVLAGTTEAATLTQRLVDLDVDVLASLAGRTSTPRALPCPTRVGGFGGVDGLVAELRARHVRALIDATHPFADVMPAHARDAAAITGVPHLRLVRPPWPSRTTWHEVDTLVAAAAAIRGRVLLTIGRQDLDAFRDVDADLLVRAVDEPAPGPWEVLRGRGPFTFDEEVELLRDRHIGTLVTRNSGGPTTKIDAADAVGVRVVVIRRPPALDAPTMTNVDDAVRWALSLG